MTSRLSAYTKDGHYLTEFDATFTRGYEINAFGKGSFTLSTYDAKALREFLQFGNLIYCEHDSLPAWGGFIDTPRDWGHGSVTISCYTYEYMMKFRNTHQKCKVSGTYGAIYQKLFEKISDVRGFEIIKLGEIYGGGESVTKDYNYGNLYDTFCDLADESSQDWGFDPYIDENGKLYFLANWYKKRGTEINYTIYEDLDVEEQSTMLREQGDIGNRVRCFGTSSSSSERIDTIRTDEESIGKYGIRYICENTDAETQAALETIGDQKLLYYKDPRKTYSINLIDRRSNFKMARLGNIINAEFYSVGFSENGFGSKSKIRILKMQNFDDVKNTLELTTDEVRE